MKKIESMIGDLYQNSVNTDSRLGPGGRKVILYTAHAGITNDALKDGSANASVYVGGTSSSSDTHGDISSY